MGKDGRQTGVFGVDEGLQQAEHETGTSLLLSASG